MNLRNGPLYPRVAAASVGFACILMSWLAPRAAGQAAASTELVLEEVTITASSGENVIGSSSTVSVIDRKTLDRFGYRSLSDALDGLAGISIQRTYLKQRMLTSRGILQDLYANKNLVMLDGIPLWHAVSGENNLDRVGLPEVRRVEVLKGPASVIYGSQAYTGAVNIVLQAVAPGDHEGEMYAGFGSGGSYESGAMVRVGNQRGLGVLVAANVSRGQRFHYSFTDEAGVRGNVTDYLDTSNVTFRASYAGHSLLINRYDHREGFLGVAPTFAQGVNGRHDIDGAAIAYKVKEKILEGWSFEALTFYDWSQRDYDRSVPLQQRSRNAGNRSGGGFKTFYDMTRDLTLTVGGDYEQRFSKEFSTYSPTSYSNGIPGRSIWERSAFGQFSWQGFGMRLVAGSRYSDNALSGGALTSRATGVYKFSETQSVKIIAAQSFRSPTLTELFSSTSTLRGNPALKPETSDSFEIAYVTKRGGLFAQALAYYATYADKIFRVPYVPNPAQNTYANGMEFNALGMEFELAYSSAHWGHSFLNLDWIHGSDDDAVADSTNPGQRSYNFKYVPKWNVAAGLSKTWGSFTAAITGRYTPETNGPKAIAGSSVKVDDFFIVDLSFAYTHRVAGQRVSHAVNVANLAGTDIEYPEFSRRRINEVPVGSQPGVFYRVRVGF